MQKLIVIGWLFLLALISGVVMGLSGKTLQAPLSIVHKLSAVACMVFMVIRISAAIRLFEGRSALLVTIVTFLVACSATLASGIVQSIPAHASPLWLNLHRFASAVAAIACAVAWRLIVIGMRK